MEIEEQHTGIRVDRSLMKGLVINSPENFIFLERINLMEIK